MASSASGRVVALLGYTRPFDTTKAVGGTNDNFMQVLAYDTKTKATTLVSTGFDGKPANDFSQDVTITADGRYVAFVSRAGNLVRGDTNNGTDLFVRDLVTRRTTRVSLDRAGKQLPRGIFDGAINPAGTAVAFDACDPITGPASTAACAVYVRELRTGKVVCASADRTGAPKSASDPRFSANGRWLAFLATGNSGLTPDTPSTYHSSAYVFDTVRHTVVRAPDDVISVQGQGSQEEHSYAAVDPSGTWVATTEASYEEIAGVPNNRTVLVNLVTGAVTPLGSAGAPAFCCAAPPVFSADGAYVVYGVGETDAQGMSTDVVYRRSLKTGAVERVSPATASPCTTDAGCATPHSVAVALDRTGDRIVLATYVRETADDPDGFGDAYLVTR